MRKALSYDDVLLTPTYSDIRSRSEISINADLGKGLKLRIPVIASPMDTISEAAMAIELGYLGGAAVIHRYNTVEMQARNVSMAKDLAGAAFLCVDVAHGHHILMQEALTSLRNLFGFDLHIMAGNVATLEGINALADWGANSVRCNIGGGSICSTRVQTGHGMPGLQTIIDCAKTDRDVAIIADGGTREGF